MYFYKYPIPAVLSCKLFVGLYSILFSVLGGSEGEIF